MRAQAVRWTWVGILFLVVAAFPLFKWARKAPLFRYGLDLAGGVNIVAQVNPFEEGRTVTPEIVTQVIQILNRRLNPRGVSEAIIQRRGATQIDIQFPGEKNPERVRKLVESRAFLEFMDAGDTPVEAGTEVTPDSHLQTFMTGDAIATADVTTSGPIGEPVVSFTLKGDWRSKFYTFTTENQNRYLCIVLDKVVISCPVIREPIPGGRGIIEGQFAWEEAADLANMLRAGSLPAKVEVVHQLQVGPLLGKTSLQQSVRALLIGAALVLLYILLYYRLAGLVADIGLAYYGVLVACLLITFDVTLTLYGIAGLILSIGMAVDANVLIVERIKEEIRSGKTVLAAVEAGHKGAFPAILDSNITTLISVVVLYYLGTGTIRGFALTLGIGVLSSMFSALVLCRNLLELVATFTLKPQVFGARVAA
ncbi:MAG: protein translocase subunit SecD [bacterium JZ-2024 1]